MLNAPSIPGPIASASLPSPFHPYSTTQIPYFWSYGPPVDWSEQMMSKRFETYGTGAFTFSSFAGFDETKAKFKFPRRVLDLGCGGNATWILKMAKQRGWERTEFVGRSYLSIYLSNHSISYSFKFQDWISFPYFGRKMFYLRI
jgi:hypothetical protein